MGTRIGVRVGPVSISDDAPGCGPGCLINFLIVVFGGFFAVGILGAGINAVAKGHPTGWVGVVVGSAAVLGVLWLLVAFNRFQNRSGQRPDQRP